MADQLLRFMLQGGSVRGEIVRLEQAWQQVVQRHQLPASVRDRLGELSAAALLLSASLKFEGKLVLQIHGDGPVALFVVESDALGGFRATVKCRDAQAIAPDASLSDLVNRHGKGRFVVTLDPGREQADKPPYQGIVPFEGDTVAEVLEHYMQRSEQIPSRLWLASDGECASGMMLQKLPEQASTEDDRHWEHCQILADTLHRPEMLASDNETLLHRLFWESPVRLLDQHACHFRCSCSREKVAAMLQMLGKEEVDSVLGEQGSVRIHCDYCNAFYRFGADDCEALW
ncbi:MAG: Hsp33 family molecular chaperone HslO [Betaproteobacteria bacterium]|nr:Hsp33 family molecular chaperone HslO [Pseudomonadota bacterium]NBO11486.1 Hsp33 family molecular chaperone HslO [Betaproteobacteria bacterium]NBO43946.1 Hsp33 family molecular chaperone HslO [Betaproteobacteria bacterium]NBP10760.1 Hsp33 family molecular chaperone HslO [Betaproteobacteria bacterium]NBP62219.1 Hsp33 family molecular chaperone HslO [Betaproteobacteria bacterium]